MQRDHPIRCYSLSEKKLSSPTFNIPEGHKPLTKKINIHFPATKESSLWSKLLLGLPGCYICNISININIVPIEYDANSLPPYRWSDREIRSTEEMGGVAHMLLIFPASAFFLNCWFYDLQKKTSLIIYISLEELRASHSRVEPDLLK